MSGREESTTMNAGSRLTLSSTASVHPASDFDGAVLARVELGIAGLQELALLFADRVQRLAALEAGPSARGAAAALRAAARRQRTAAGSLEVVGESGTITVGTPPSSSKASTPRPATSQVHAGHFSDFGRCSPPGIGRVGVSFVARLNPPAKL